MEKRREIITDCTDAERCCQENKKLRDCNIRMEDGFLKMMPDEMDGSGERD